MRAALDAHVRGIGKTVFNAIISEEEQIVPIKASTAVIILILKFKIDRKWVFDGRCSDGIHTVGGRGNRATFAIRRRPMSRALNTGTVQAANNRRIHVKGRPLGEMVRRSE